MKLARYLVLLGITAFAFSLSAFAKSADSGSFNLGETARVGSTALAPGHYKAEWSGPANDLKIDIWQNGKEVASAEGHLKDLGQQAKQDEVLTRELSDNTTRLEEIQFHHRTEALDFSK